MPGFVSPSSSLSIDVLLILLFSPIGVVLVVAAVTTTFSTGRMSSVPQSDRTTSTSSVVVGMSSSEARRPAAAVAAVLRVVFPGSTAGGEMDDHTLKCVSMSAKRKMHQSMNQSISQPTRKKRAKVRVRVYTILVRGWVQQKNTEKFPPYCVLRTYPLFRE